MKIFVNLLTTFRLINSLALFLLKQKISGYWFIANIMLIFFTDSLDGFLARKFNVQTLYGSMMDTIADKALCIILIILSVERIDSFAYILIGEIIISVINIVFKMMGRNAKSRKIGKIKMWAISFTLVLGYLNYFGIINNMILVNIGSTITLLLQILAIIDYINYLKQKENIQENKKKIRSKEDLFYVLFSTEYYLSIA